MADRGGLLGEFYGEGAEYYDGGSSRMRGLSLEDDDAVSPSAAAAVATATKSKDTSPIFSLETLERNANRGARAEDL